MAPRYKFGHGVSVGIMCTFFAGPAQLLLTLASSCMVMDIIIVLQHILF